MAGAVLWGSISAGSLVLGALLAFARDWSHRQVGVVLAFGAGALISAVSFELAAEGARAGGLRPLALGLAAGALVYFALDGVIDKRFAPANGGGTAGSALALGAFLDGVPEQLVLGIGLAGGSGVSVGLVVAIFVSNLPEAIGSASDMRSSGTSRARVMGLWVAVALICVLSTVAGYAIADAVSGELRAVVNGFAAGALLVMLIDSMIPKATKDAGRTAGLLATLGFAISTGLSSLG
jgi:ZIP family zinc transporter